MDALITERKLPQGVSTFLEILHLWEKSSSYDDDYSPGRITLYDSPPNLHKTIDSTAHSGYVIYLAAIKRMALPGHGHLTEFSN